MRNDQKGGPLKQDDFIRVTDFTKLFQLRFQHSDIGNEIGDNLGPCLVQGFIPTGRSETLKVLHYATCLLYPSDAPDELPTSNIVTHPMRPKNNSNHEAYFSSLSSFLRAWPVLVWPGPAWPGLG